MNSQVTGIEGMSHYNSRRVHQEELEASDPAVVEARSRSASGKGIEVSDEVKELSRDPKDEWLLT